MNRPISFDISRYEPPEEVEFIKGKTTSQREKTKKRKKKYFWVSTVVLILLVITIIVVPAIFFFVFVLTPNIPQTFVEEIAEYPVLQLPAPYVNSLVLFNGSYWITNSNEITIEYINVTGPNNQIVFSPNEYETLTINVANATGKWIYSIPNADQNADFILTTTPNTFSGNVTFNSVVYFNTSQPQLCFQNSNGTNTGICILVEDPSTTLYYTLLNVGKNTTFILVDTPSQTINNIKEFQSTIYLKGNASTGQAVFFPQLNGTTTTILNVTTPASNITLTLPDGGANSHVLLDHGPLTINGAVDFLDTVVLGGNPDYIVFDQQNTTLSINLNAINSSANYLIPDIFSNGYFVMSTTLVTPNQTTTFFSKVILAANTDQLIFRPGGGSNTFIALNAGNPSANEIYTIPDAGTNASFAFLEASQTFSGINTFHQSTTFGSSYEQIIIQPGGSGTMFILNTTNPASSVTVGIPDPRSTIANLVMLQGSQIINGELTMTSQVNLAAATEQIIINPSSNSIIISATNPASASRTVTIPDAGQSSAFVFTQGVQTIDGSTTFTNDVVADIGVFLPTSGGIPAPLNYYEVVCGTNTYRQLTWTSQPITGAPIDVKIRGQRVNNIVTLFFDYFTATCNQRSLFQVLGGLSTFPDWALPGYAGTSAQQLYTSVIAVIDFGANAMGLFTYFSNGTLNIALGPNGGAFNGTGETCGWNGFTVSWMAA